MDGEKKATKRKSIKSRMLAMVLIPSLALLLVGLGISAYLVNQGVQTYQWANDLRAAVGPGTKMVTDLQIERWLSLVQVGGGQVPQTMLDAQRGKVNTDLTAIDSTASAMPSLAEIVRSSFGNTASPWNQLPDVRKQVDNGGISLLDTYTYYDQLLGPVTNYVSSVANDAPNAQIADAQLTAASLYGATEDVARANAVSFAAAIRGGMNGDEFAEYARQVGAYQSALQSLVPRMTPTEQADYHKLIASTAWQQLASVQTALSAHGPTLVGISTAAPPLAVKQLDWQNDTIQVTAQMLGLFDDHFQYAADLAASNGRNTLIRALIAGVIILLAGIAVLVVATRMSNRVVRRLGRLRRETLDLADEHLPRMVAQLRSGEPIDLHEQMPVLRHGQDEIGQVAEAFNKAQHTAVSAAVQEAKTRQGANAVFLNIAHRSQIVAHRQLSVLDLAERDQEDPQQVQFLFQLDHLATRARRNAENLLILGGRRPARQWRDAVPIRDVVRSAIAETEHFSRIKITRLPRIAIAGMAVTDVAHLLAELLDNATAFAPPEARAEVSGNLVGRGAVLEIEDQGLGIPPEQRDAINHQLSSPPDYGVMALSSDDRLGMFVVARLAAQHGIRITLTESIYGGTRAVVVLPATLIEVEGRAPELLAEPPKEHEPEPEVALPDWPATDVEPVLTVDVDDTQAFAPVPAPIPTDHNGHEPPPLPRRQRQASIAPQLVKTSYLAPESADRTPDQVRNAVAAFQRGTHRARNNENGNGNGSNNNGTGNGAGDDR